MKISIFELQPYKKIDLVKNWFCVKIPILNEVMNDRTMNITSRNNAPILNLGGGFRLKRSKVNIFQQFSKKSRKTKKKNDKKREFLRKTNFRPNRFFLYGCNSKTNHCKYLKFSPNVYISVIYIHKSSTFLTQIFTKSPKSASIQIQLLTKIRQNCINICKLFRSDPHGTYTNFKCSKRDSIFFFLIIYIIVTLSMFKTIIDKKWDK
ncbi:Uncharacterized protein FWK35_00001509 [Aphis craccivora]|uniref:Uncharacterized protein n=1 Tax=Aphis craccivora TaxID=307492 RepID=A0A6G0ZAX5_APHCR|nr:Uncharacterized protein FWK35_00001509 [Aphis craccivora]